MGRTGCIVHPPRFPFLIYRPEYLLLTEDPISAKLLSWFEFLTDSALASDGDSESPWLGCISAADLRVGLIADATEHYIRDRLDYLVAESFLERRGSRFRSEGMDYRLNYRRVQSCMDTALEMLRSKDQGYDLDLLGEVLRSFSRGGIDQKIEVPRSKDRFSIYKKYREFKEDIKTGTSSIDDPSSLGNFSETPEEDRLEEFGSQQAVKVSLSEEKATRSKRTKGSGRRKPKSADEIYAILGQDLYEPAKFEAWWIWYRDKVCRVFGVAYGDKAAAAQAWINLVDDGVDLQRISDGSAAYLRALRGMSNPVGVPHGNNFLEGKRGHPTPYWRAALEEGAESGGDFDFGFVPEVETLQESARELGRLLRVLGSNLPDASRECPGCHYVTAASELSPEELRALVRWASARASEGDAA